MIVLLYTIFFDNSMEKGIILTYSKDAAGKPAAPFLLSAGLLLITPSPLDKEVRILRIRDPDFFLQKHLVFYKWNPATGTLRKNPYERKLTKENLQKKTYKRKTGFLQKRDRHSESEETLWITTYQQSPGY